MGTVQKPKEQRPFSKCKLTLKNTTYEGCFVWRFKLEKLQIKISDLVACTVSRTVWTL